MSARRPKLLVIDDGDRYTELAHTFLRQYDYATRCDLPGPCWTCEKRPGCTLTHAHHAVEADTALEKHDDTDVVLLDVSFQLPEAQLIGPSDMDLVRKRKLQGLEILVHLRRLRGELPVVLMTSEEELGYEDAAAALRADEFVTLAGADAFDARALGLLVERVLARRREAPETGGFQWGKSAAMARLRRDALTLAPTSLPILLVGETGTGKSALAERVIHPASGRKGAFVSVDLGAIPPTLMAAELFGSSRGAFSGAVERAGRFEAAHGGTLFLDEIGNLPPEGQRMLLVALQEGKVTRLGETTSRTVDVKLVAATNADLAAQVRAGTFRADLYSRLNPAARLVMPSLRDRRADLEELLSAFVRKTFAAGADRALLVRYLEAAGIAGTPHVELVTRERRARAERGIELVLAPRDLAVLERHDWPGNVRELEQLVRNACVFALADALAAAQEGRGGTQAFARTIPIPSKLVRDLVAGAFTREERADAAGRASVELRAGKTLHSFARDVERQLYARLFEETEGNFEEMARRLLGRAEAVEARKVRLRFNQLGLRARSKK